jgi:hypothetical protein
MIMTDLQFQIFLDFGLCTVATHLFFIPTTLYDTQDYQKLFTSISSWVFANVSFPSRDLSKLNSMEIRLLYFQWEHLNFAIKK